MVVLDISIVNVALPSIQRDLGFSPSGLQWVVDAYTLAFAGLLMLGGRAADLFGRRRMFLVGLGMFTAASLIGGMAQSQATLIAARAIQGIGAAVLAPATLTLLTASFAEGPARARALGVWSAVAASGASAGALLGGALTELATWRWILFVNVPLGLVALLAARWVLPESREDAGSGRLDVAGALTVTGGLMALVYGIVGTETHPWSSAHTLVSLGASAVLLAAFVVIQARVAEAPLVPLRIFRSRSVAAANAVMLLFYLASFAVWYFETLFMQRVLGYSPLEAGLAFLPQTLLIAAGSQLTSRLVARMGPRVPLVAGTLLSVVALAWLSRITPSGSFLSELLGPYLLAGIGFGLSITPLTVAATTGVSREEAGLASGLLNTSRMVGASIGLAALATVAADRTAALVRDATSGAAALTQGYVRAIDAAGALLVVAAIVAAVAIPSRPASRRAGAEATTDGAEVVVLHDDDLDDDGLKYA